MYSVFEKYINSYNFIVKFVWIPRICLTFENKKIYIKRIKSNINVYNIKYDK